MEPEYEASGQLLTGIAGVFCCPKSSGAKAHSYPMKAILELSLSPCI